MADYQSSHSGPTIDTRVSQVATNTADIAALKSRMNSAEAEIDTKADTASVTALSSQVGGVLAKIPSEATTSNKLADKAYVDSSVSGKASQSDLTNLTNRVSAVENKIPSNASSSNQLADKSFVNTGLASKQATLVSGTNIATINGQSLLNGGDIVAGDPNAVKYVAQSLTDSQKAQARTNIGAASAEEVSQLEAEVDGLFVSASDADLNISDEYGHNLARFKDGDFQVKNFDSSRTPQQGDVSYDFAVVDESGNAIVAFRDGHIQTKNFYSKGISARTQWYGKKVSVIGDSISTTSSHNAVEFTVLESDISEGRTLQGYPTYYDIGTTIGGVSVTSSMVGELTSFTPASGDAGKTIGKAKNYNTASSSGVGSYEDTWWYKLATELGMQVLQNVSWSGASICSHEGNDNEYKTSYAWHPAQINKLSKRDSNGNTISPDVVIIYRGTNDMTHTPYASLSDFGANATSIPNTDYADSSYDFKVAYCLTIKKIREAYPQAKIVLCTLNVFKRINYSQFPTNNGTNTLPEYNNAIREVADMMGCGLIEFDKDGITFENCYPTYISDSSTIPTHPNPTGHTVMAEKAITDIKKF